MAKQYKGSLTLEWYNKKKSILLRDANEPKGNTDVPAPMINWINKDEALFYEINEEEGKGLTPYWVDRSDLRVKEARPLTFQKAYRAIPNTKQGTLNNINIEYVVEELNEDDPSIENILIRGDNLLALNSLKKIFDQKTEEEKVKTIYIDPPYNSGNAFEVYDDNLSHSEWLTMMRDRLVILHSILSNKGSIFVQIDDKEIANCKLILDEIFGQPNFISIITIKRSAPTGHKAINPTPVSVCDYLIAYAKNRELWEYKIQHTKRDYDSAYNKFIEPFSGNFENWKFITINQAKEKYNLSIDHLIRKFPERIIRFAQPNYKGVGRETRDLIDLSKKHPEKVYKQIRDSAPDIYLKNGDRILFYKDKLKIIDGELATAEPLTNIWDDIPFQGIANEGNVVFQKNKKPEKLIKRVFEISTDEGDIVLDCFGGSGTTFSVAQKLNLRWVGVEIGSHADTMIIPRLYRVMLGKDQTGISKSVNWKGGGAFKYYHLGPSIIQQDEKRRGDFNWNLGRDFIEESLLSSYDYKKLNLDSITIGKLFEDGEKPVIGINQVGNKTEIGVISLKGPEDEKEFIHFDEIIRLYNDLKEEFKPEYITVFTNRGIEMAEDSRPSDLEIIKVPQAIFTELEK